MRARNPREYRGYEYVVHAAEGWYEIPDLAVMGIADDEEDAVDDVHDVIDAFLVRELNPARRLPNIIVRKPEAEKFLRKALKGRKTDYYVLSEPKNLGGPYSSLEKAKTRLRQVEYFKRVKPGRRRNQGGGELFSFQQDEGGDWWVLPADPGAPDWNVTLEEVEQMADEHRREGHRVFWADDATRLRHAPPVRHPWGIPLPRKSNPKVVDGRNYPTADELSARVAAGGRGGLTAEGAKLMHELGILSECSGHHKRTQKRKRNWDTPAEAKEYVLKRWGREAYRSGVDTTSMTWREFADWVRRSGEPGGEEALRVVEDEPGFVGDFPLPVDPIPRQYLAETIARSSRAARSTLNPRAPGITPMLEELENYLGPLSDGHRQAILDYLDDPTEEGWDRIHALILVPDSLRLATTWQWVMHVDPTFPRSRPSGARWPRIPDSFTLARAIRAAADKRGDGEDGGDDDNGGDGDDGEPLPVPLVGGRSSNRAPKDDLRWRRADRYEGVLHPGDYASAELAPGIRYELRRRQVWDVWLVRGDTATRVASNRDLDGAKRAAARDAAEVLSLAREIAEASPRAANRAPEWDLQTVIVSKDEAPTRGKATTIAREFAKRIYTSRETSDSWRFRQRPPKDFVERSFRTRRIPGRGVSLVYGRLKRGAKRRR